MSFWDVDSSAARPGRAALERWGTGRFLEESIVALVDWCFVRAALPGTLRIAEVHFHIGGHCKRLVLGHLQCMVRRRFASEK
jgi:hypothetical protein